MRAEQTAHSVALAHHWLVTMRGGEKALAAIAEAFPSAPIYTLLSRPEQLEDSLRNRQIITSWLQRFGWISGVQRYALPLLPSAARSLDASNHDVVICSDAAIIKAIRTRDDALKICYCYSPMRYLWDLYDEYYAHSGIMGRIGLKLFAEPVRRADLKAAETVSAFVAISRFVADRIRRAYNQPSVIIPPPGVTDYPPNIEPPEDFYLVVGEHVPYKRNDLAIDACTQAGKRLVVIGGGPLLNAMRTRAGKTVEVLGWQPDTVVRDYMRRCRALLFCGQEDFGIVPVEVQAAGRPVIAYGSGGILETVVEGGSGVFFKEQSVGNLIEALERFETSESLWPSAQIQEHARQFDIGQFHQRFTRFYDWCISIYQASGPGGVRQAMAAVGPDSFL
jgi:glycosyltransferase involved in cell wall biosynthesis